MCRIVRGSEPNKQAVKPRKIKSAMAQGLKHARKQSDSEQKPAMMRQHQPQPSTFTQCNSMTTVFPSAPSKSISSVQGVQNSGDDAMQSRTRNSDSDIGDSPDSIVQNTPPRHPEHMTSELSRQSTTETSDSAMTSSEDHCPKSTVVSTTDYDIFDAFGHDLVGSDEQSFLEDPMFQLSQDQDCDDFGPKISFSPFATPKTGRNSLSGHANILSGPIRSPIAELNDAQVMTSAQLEVTKPGPGAAHPVSMEQQNEAVFVDLEEVSDDPLEAELYLDLENYNGAEHMQIDKAAMDVEQSATRSTRYEVVTGRSRQNSPKTSILGWNAPLYRVDGFELSSPFDRYLHSHCEWKIQRVGKRDANSRIVFSVLAPSLYPVAPERNPYTCVYGKMAASCLPLRATILEASARHLGSMGQLPPGIVTLYCDSSWQALKSAISAWKQSVALAATLLLSITVEVRTSEAQS